ncbi:MAG: DUF3999 family protein [Candidatus Hydrogenedentes bacterium]|nr:DUF3999 family protein [Candidatus Hydrogenedentota bacterium]
MINSSKKRNGERWVCVLCALALCCAWTAQSGAVEAEDRFDARDWAWTAPVEQSDAEGEFLRLTITPDIMDKSHSSLRDLRVLDHAGKLVPHVLHFDRTEAELAWGSTTLMNRTFRIGNFDRTVIHFPDRTQRNRIRVGLSGDNYRRYALLEGSEDKSNWAAVASTWMFKVPNDGEIFETDIFRFPTNDFPYLRLTVLNMEDETRRIHIRSVKYAHYKQAEIETTSVTLTATFVEPDDTEREKNATILVIDLGYNNLPLEELRLEITNPYFYRPFDLSGRRAETETIQRKSETGWDDIERDIPWSHLRRGVFYRIQKDGEMEEQLAVEKIRTPYRYLRLRIFNGDDAPLKLDAAAVVAQRRALGSLVFAHAHGETYSLIFGNEKASAPKYDLARAIEGVDEIDVPTVGLGAVNALIFEPEAPAWSTQYAWVIWVVLIVAVVLMVGLIGRNMSNLAPED